MDLLVSIYSTTFSKAHQSCIGKNKEVKFEKNNTTIPNGQLLLRLTNNCKRVIMGRPTIL